MTIWRANGKYEAMQLEKLEEVEIMLGFEITARIFVFLLYTKRGTIERFSVESDYYLTCLNRTMLILELRYTVVEQLWKHQGQLRDYYQKPRER